MNMSFIKESLTRNREKTAVITDGREYAFSEIAEELAGAEDFLEGSGIPVGSVVALLADFKPASMALFVALIERDCIIVPISQTIKQVESYIKISESEYFIDLTGEKPIVNRTGAKAAHGMLLGLRGKGHPGLVLFSSGTTGEPKAALHDLASLLDKFRRPGKTLRTITFLLFDHIGGFNTMMHALANGGTIVTLGSRKPEDVCALIERHKVELLPTSPTFINMILLNHTYEKYDLSSLKIISYGTEPMPESTLVQMSRLLPGTRMKQTYGLSELGIMATKSESSDSLFMKLGGEGFETKIVDGILYVRAKSAMLGYLNAPSPFDEDGWFNTKDRVEQKGDYIKILGRTTDLINVGGEKVYPIEVESALLECEGVLDARVYGEDNPLSGKSVTAEVKVDPGDNNRAFIRTLRGFCKDKLERYKIPSRFLLTEGDLFGERFKKKR